MIQAVSDRDLFIKTAQHISPDKAGTDSLSVAMRVPRVVNGLHTMFAECMVPSDTALTTVLKDFKKDNDSWSGIRTVEHSAKDEEIVLSVFRLQTPAEEIFNTLVPSAEMVMYKALTLAARIRTEGQGQKVHGADILTEVLVRPRPTNDQSEEEHEPTTTHDYRTVMRLYGAHRVIESNLLMDLHWLGLPHPQLVPDISTPWKDPKEVNPNLHVALNDFEAAIARLDS